MRFKVRSASSMAAGCLSVFVFGCATKPMSPAPTHFFASWSGVQPDTQPLFEAVDSQMRRQSEFLRDFDNTMEIHISDGEPASGGKLRFQVRLTLDPRMHNRRISEGDRTLAHFDVSCAPNLPQPCVDRIIRQARLQPARIRRIVAHSPQA